MNKLTQQILFSSSSQSEDQTFSRNENERLAFLKQHFPNCFDKHGAFLPEKMAEILHSDGIATQKEGYSLNWLGKSYARALKDTPPETLLSEDTEHNRRSASQSSENLLIKGDNLEVLKHLKNAYKNQIKMIYIDPPYNTGSDGFVYQDDRKFTPEQLAQLGGMDLDEAKRVLEFTAKKSNSHSAWLTFMYPRLYVARELLREDGVIFISIDDNEQVQLKILCDEVFGEENFVSQIIWQKKTGSSDEDEIAVITEYIFMYRKTSSFIAGKNSDSYDIHRYNLTDEYLEERGNYYTDNLDRGGLQYSDSMNYGIECPDGSLAFPNGRSEKVEEGWIWKWSKEKVKWGIENGFIEIKKSTRKACGWAVYYKNYLFVDNEGNPIQRSAPYKNLIIDDVLNTDATLELKNLLQANKVFSSPKPSFLIKKLIAFVEMKSNDIVLDFFAGSGTTAHAVMQFNSENKGLNLNFVCVQLPENLDETLNKATGKQKEVVKNAIRFLDKHNKPHNLFEITKARIELAATKIRTECPDYSGDLGFKIFETVPKFDFQNALNDDFDPTQAELPTIKDMALNDEQLHTLLTTWRVYDGSKLPEKVQTVDLVGYTAYYCRNHLYLLASGFHSECIKALIEKLDNDKDFVPERIVLLSANMDSAMQKELAQAVKTYVNKKGLNNLSVLARM